MRSWPERAAPAEGEARWAARWARRGAAFDLRWAIALHHRGVARPALVRLLCATSRLGDGLLWYVALLTLALMGFNGGPQAWTCGLQMVAVGSLNMALYWGVKRRIARARPFVSCPDIRACTHPLDTFSFPSGHTLHAVSFALVLTHHYPSLWLVLWSFAALVATSRVVLGLHYPSDVLVGAATGVLTAAVVRTAWAL